MELMAVETEVQMDPVLEPEIQLVILTLRDMVLIYQ